MPNPGNSPSDLLAGLKVIATKVVLGQTYRREVSRL